MDKWTRSKFFAYIKYDEVTNHNGEEADNHRREDAEWLNLYSWWWWVLIWVSSHVNHKT